MRKTTGGQKAPARKTGASKVEAGKVAEQKAGASRTAARRKPASQATKKPVITAPGASTIVTAAEAAGRAIGRAVTTATTAVEGLIAQATMKKAKSALPRTAGKRAR